MVNINRFKGSLVGLLVGDCLGAPFEGMSKVYNAHLTKYFAQLHDPNLKLPFKPYTDDTAMMKSVALSLIQYNGYNAQDMAKRFVVEYFKEPKRGYGSSIRDVFMALKLTEFEDPYGPARKQFQGMGSYGNGAAMRITPVALLYTNSNSNISKLIETTELSSKLTHSNRMGYRGALLQAFAVNQALNLHTETAFDGNQFVDELILKMREQEKDDVHENIDGQVKRKVGIVSGVRNADPLSYVKKLEIVKEFLSRKESPSLEEIQKTLGVHVSAYMSVPTALYCFLAAQKEIQDIECDNKYQRCIQFAFSLGGDTDTIGCMAGAIIGAQMGIEGIPPGLLKHCEAVETVLKLAEDLFSLSQSQLSDSAISKDQQAAATIKS